MTVIFDNIINILFITGYVVPLVVSLCYITYHGLKEKAYRYLFRNTLVCFIPLLNIVALINALEDK